LAKKKSTKKPSAKQLAARAKFAAMAKARAKSRKQTTRKVAVKRVINDTSVSDQKLVSSIVGSVTDPMTGIVYGNKTAPDAIFGKLRSAQLSRVRVDKNMVV
jgi:hypothetical protein